MLPGQEWRLQIKRVSLDDPGALLPGIRHTGSKQRRHQAMLTVWPGDKEAGNRPDRLRIDALEDARSIQRNEVLARPDRAPADRLLLSVRNQPRHLAALQHGLQAGFGTLALLLLECRALQTPEHAPAAGVGTALPEEAFQIWPALCTGGMNSREHA